MNRYSELLSALKSKMRLEFCTAFWVAPISIVTGNPSLIRLEPRLIASEDALAPPAKVTASPENVAGFAAPGLMMVALDVPTESLSWPAPVVKLQRFFRLA